MENLQIFTKDEFGTIRTIKLDNQPYFCMVDICKALDIKNVSDAKERLNEDGVVTNEVIDSLGRKQKANFINESNMYKLIFQSRKESAERFTDWVTSEVLPTIRKTGGYVNNDEMFINTYLPFADKNTKLLFSQTLRTVREQNAIIQNQKKEIMHKEDVIIGLVEDIDLATKRQRITQIVRRCSNKKYQERYRLLYTEFEKKYHCNLSIRMENNTLKPKARNTMDYIDRGMNMIPQLYEIACKLFENDVEALKSEWESVVA